MALTQDNIQHFFDHGWVKLNEGFPRDKVLHAQDAVWELMRERGHAVYRDRPETWTQPLIHLKECIDGDERFNACYTELWREAVEDLVGKGRWTYRNKNPGFGWWPINFVNPEIKNWKVPAGG
jgi:hypothetical protein